MELVPGNDDVRLTSPGVKLTYDDFVLFPDDGKRHELIDGEHYVSPSPNRKHQKIAGNLYLASVTRRLNGASTSALGFPSIGSSTPRSM
jgi:hypothetical protein